MFDLSITGEKLHIYLDITVNAILFCWLVPGCIIFLICMYFVIKNAINSIENNGADLIGEGIFISGMMLAMWPLIVVLGTIVGLYKLLGFIVDAVKAVNYYRNIKG